MLLDIFQGTRQPPQQRINSVRRAIVLSLSKPAFDPMNLELQIPILPPVLLSFPPHGVPPLLLFLLSPSLTRCIRGHPSGGLY